MADMLYAKIRVRSDGKERGRTAVLAMGVVRKAWTVAWRSRDDAVPAKNPFVDMDLYGYQAKRSRPVRRGELNRFVAAADAAGEPSLGTAAMIVFYFLQLQTDILGRLSWTHYRSAEKPNHIQIFHNKTGVLVDVPLYNEDGTCLWPEIVARLDSAPRKGGLIVTGDLPDRTRKICLPWEIDYFRHRFAAIRLAAGIGPEVKFMGLRHGGNVEAADAGLTDAQMRALSGHKTVQAPLRYAQASDEQSRVGGSEKTAG
ncbi:hypothetical protein GCM10007874_68830 [Labrys miyagiensis]|uniref:Phage integrase family protein n=1 Tax=Labrys miyagiensis TaxID=346912 RepID=A0ABQ6CZX7_9HYPH|nr:hypothetical protein [Labrys miyagiensis]GLS23862.1 hypothetical protein GCM10007874_68830 [Labrys miyagiensis]